MPPWPSSGELWGHHLMPTYIDLDCLLPNGIYIRLPAEREATLEALKRSVLEEASTYPLSSHLLELSSYIFVGITQDAEVEEFYDETRRLCDLKLFLPTLKLVEPVGNREDKMLNYEIGLALGISTNEFNEMTDLEVMSFRRDMIEVCKMAVEHRLEDCDKTALAMYLHPPDIDFNPVPPPHIKEILCEMNDQVIVCVWVYAESATQKYTIKVRALDTPTDIVAGAIRKKYRSQGRSEADQSAAVDRYCQTYVLKVCGCEEYLLRNCPIVQYKYVRKCLLAKDSIIQLMMMKRDELYKNLPTNKFILPSYIHRGLSALDDLKRQPTLNLWSLECRLKITVFCAYYITVKEAGKMYIKMGVYHGTEALCPDVKTHEVFPGKPLWNEPLEFDLHLHDIPRAARLCLAICFKKKKEKKNSSSLNTCLAWGNLNLFDSNSRMHSDKMSLSLWNAGASDDLLHPIGSVGCNPSRGAPCLEIEFDRFANPVNFPNKQEVDHYCIWHHKQLMHMSRLPHASEKTIEAILEIISRDPLAEFAEQDKNLIWEYRHLMKDFPGSLPKLLISTKWCLRNEVAQVYHLLQQWPYVEPEIALELLDCKYMDPMVRQFAVRSLEEKLDDNKLSLYLMQLVQVLRFEPYLDNPLTHFLLMRALLNRNIGHSFFWHLKSEMNLVECRLRFGLLLEAYLRGCGTHLQSLVKQVEAVEKLAKLTDQLKNEREEDHRLFLKGHVSKKDYLEALQNLQSPLNNSHILGTIVQNKCKIMKSKKKPLFLEWTNDSPLAELYQQNFQIMFKNGDDLRQDMLTLQIIRIMDSIWQSEGLDMRMTPYPCLATGHNMGLIGIVRHAETVMHIQKKEIKSAMQMSSTMLHKWLKDHNPNSYDDAVETFTKSCAGYAVATYVLGIGDRHPDNIMVTKEGKVFHIDFGHFLDHRKKKFGINRERVPFVLTHDFIHTVAKGSDNPLSSTEFQEFQELCGRAYVCLRRHSNLLITLFSMMLSSGIPELQSPDDISYLRKTLAVEESEEQSIKFFQRQFHEAYGGNWTTKVDWFFHWLKNRNS